MTLPDVGTSTQTGGVASHRWLARGSWRSENQPVPVGALGLAVEQRAPGRKAIVYKDHYLITINQYVLAFDCCRPNQVDELEKELGVRLVISADGTSVKVFSTSERE